MSYITSPNSPIDVINAFQRQSIWNSFGITLNKQNPRPFYTACIAEENFSYCIFTSFHIIEMIKENIAPNNRCYLMDATFKIVPHGCFNQLLIIYITYFDKVSS